MNTLIKRYLGVFAIFLGWALVTQPVTANDAYKQSVWKFFPDQESSVVALESLGDRFLFDLPEDEIYGSISLDVSGVAPAATGVFEPDLAAELLKFRLKLKGTVMDVLPVGGGLIPTATLFNSGGELTLSNGPETWRFWVAQENYSIMSPTLQIWRVEQFATVYVPALLTNADTGNQSQIEMALRLVPDDAGRLVVDHDYLHFYDIPARRLVEKPRTPLGELLTAPTPAEDDELVEQPAAQASLQLTDVRSIASGSVRDRACAAETSLALCRVDEWDDEDIAAIDMSAVRLALSGRLGVLGEPDGSGPPFQLDLLLLGVPAVERPDGDLVTYFANAAAAIDVDGRLFEAWQRNSGVTMAKAHYDPDTERIGYLIPLRIAWEGEQPMAAVLHVVCQGERCDEVTVSDSVDSTGRVVAQRSVASLVGLTEVE